MTPYVLMLWLFLGSGPEWANAPVVIDMPDLETCKTALNNWGNVPYPRLHGTFLGFKQGFCISRQGIFEP